MKKLLNIDGGGVRVYFPLLIMNYIEKKTNKKIIDIFDFYSGVSASSIILSAILTNYSIEQVIELFKRIAKIIFYKSYFYTIKSCFGLLQSKYSDYYINTEFEKFFTGLKLSDAKKPLSILTYDLANSSPICWHSFHDTHKEYDLWKLVRGSTSAPTYFPPFILDSHILIDGGVITNNLSELIFTHALVYYGHQEEFFQISIGTGNYNPKITHTPSGLWSWSSSIINVFFNASASYEMNTLKKISKIENLKHFFRLDIDLDKDIKLDDYTAFDKMDNIFAKWLEQNQSWLDAICEQLMKC
jgi:patatin-like phospholipase/acyl hydrolase